MRLLIATPEQSRLSGNWVSACRFRDGLQRLGHQVELVETGLDPSRLEAAVDRFRPELALLLHAYRSGRPWLAGRCWKRLPFLVLLTGTDIHQGLELAPERPIIEAMLQRAGAILSQNPLTIADLAARRPELAPRLHYLPPGIVLGQAPYPLRRRHGIAAETVLFLHPAGIRPVKANLDLLELFAPVAAAAPHSRLAFCGPLLDANYGARFLAAVEPCAWADYLGEIPLSAMPAALREADVICNNSLSEGLANSLLEAASIGRPMLARGIEGNLAVVEPGRNGLCYASAEEFTAQALALAQDPELRQRLSRSQPQRYGLEPEARALEAICRRLLRAERP